MPKIIEPVLTPRDLPWARQTMERLASVESAVDRLATDLLASNKGLASALAALGKQINALPIPASDANTQTPISATSASWTTKAAVTLAVPGGKTMANISAVGSIALLDTVTGGVAAPPSARFLIGGASYPLANGVPATKDAGASQVNNVVTLGAATQLSVSGGGTVTVELQVSVPHSTAYATNSFANFATLSVQALFS